MFDGEYTNLVKYCCVMTNNDEKVKTSCKDCSKPKRHFQYVVYIYLRHAHWDWFTSCYRLHVTLSVL